MQLDNEEYLLLSGIQHFAFCPRQWALIHIEGVWSENYLTAQGRILHEKADDPWFNELRKGKMVSRSMPIRSQRLRIQGVADIVELVESPEGVSVPGKKGLWLLHPVEYKRGKPKSEDCDRLQLCAQAMCLEEMLHTEIPQGELYYGQIRRRNEVELDDTLRAEVEKAVAEMQRMYELNEVPMGRKEKKCKACSLVDDCNPELGSMIHYGKFLARTSGKINGNVLVRKKMYRMSDKPEEALPIAKNFVLGKVANCRAVLERGLRDHRENIDAQSVENASRYLHGRLSKIRSAESSEVLLGYEGECAKTYFESLDHLILANKDIFFINNRSRRPPLDNMNAILSYIYTVLMHDVQSALESVGLDSYVGFYHRDRPGRASLALDLMEELRPVLADRLALSLVNRKQLSGKGFLQKESGAVLMADDARKTLLHDWQTRKREEIIHPFLNEKIPIGLIPYVQAMLLSKHIRGELDGYPPFFWK